MKRLTTDTPKNNFEMALNLFYVKDEDVWVRGYGKNGADISLLDLTREILSYQCPYVESDISDDDLIEMMPEWLFDDVRSTEHVVGLLYQAAWVCAELREDLKQFEDMGISPQACAETREIEETLSGWDYSISRMVELMKADVEGRVVILPCKVGQRVFALMDKHISECEVKQIGMGNEIGFIGLEQIGARGREYGVALNGFGKTVFLSREEAEKALQEMKGDTEK